jgi:hypothetical protein
MARVRHNLEYQRHQSLILVLADGFDHLLRERYTALFRMMDMEARDD